MRGNGKYKFIPRFPVGAPPGAILCPISLKKYCEQRHITKDQARTLAKKKWLYATKIRGRIFVAELHPHMIDAWFAMKPSKK